MRNTIDPGLLVYLAQLGMPRSWKKISVATTEMSILRVRLDALRCITHAEAFFRNAALLRRVVTSLADQPFGDKNAGLDGVNCIANLNGKPL